MSNLYGIPSLGRRTVAATLLRAALTAVALVVLYYALPLNGRFPDSAWILFPLGLAAFGYLSYRGIRNVVQSDTPRMRAIQVLATVVPFFIVLMASIYVVMSTQSHSSFSAVLTRTDSLYFTVTVFATVGFGDITPVSETARIIVMLQMILDLVVVGAGVQVLVSAVRMNVARRHSSGEADGLDPAPPE